MRLVCLVENTVRRPGLRGEHGLSLLLELGDDSWLLDTGASSTAVANARVLGLPPPTRGVILSHGHRDHTGGLLAVLGWAGTPLPVLHGPGVFRTRLAVAGGAPPRPIGMPWRRRQVEQAGGRLRVVRRPRWLDEHLLCTGPIPGGVRLDPRLQIRVRGELVPDSFTDEVAVVLRRGSDGISVITGCGHRGVVPTVRHALQVTGARRLHAVVGGAHLAHATPRQVDRVAGQLAALEPRQLALCHCTGDRALERLRATFGRRLTTLHVGDDLPLD